MSNALRIHAEAEEIRQQVADELDRRGMYSEMKKILDARVVISSRLRTTAGRAYYHANRIEISLNIFSREDNAHGLHETVVHELAHLITRGHHGEEWRNMMSILGYPDVSRCHSLKVNHNRRRKTQATCTRCGKKISVSTRMANLVRKEGGRRHKTCGGLVVVPRMPKR